jgi:sec-independent protein translocase protein TatC
VTSDSKNEKHLPAMSLGDHLEELRARIILALVGLGVGAVISSFFGDYFIKVLMNPYEIAVRKAGILPHMQTYTVAEPFMLYMKAVLILSVLISSPWIFYQFWAFIAAGLYEKERRFVYQVVPFSVGLFVVGVVFFLFVIAPMTMQFFVTFKLGVSYIDNIPRVSDYIDLIMVLALIFGLSFQIPLVIIFAERLGLIQIEMLRKYRKYVFLGAFIVAAVVTPSPDMICQTALALPLYILYESSVLYCSFKRKKEVLPKESQV